MSILGQKIKEKRNLKGLTQEDLANLSGVNLRTIQRIENNQSQPRGKTLILICDALNIDLEELLLEAQKFNNSKITQETDYSNKETKLDYELATKTERFLASIFDTILVTFATYIPFLVFTKVSFISFIKFSSTPLGFVLFGLFAFVFGAIIYPLFKGNVGHRILNLKVISEETSLDYDKPINGALRELLKYFLCFLIIPMVWILWDDKNQNLYDKITKTYVVKA